MVCGAGVQGCCQSGRHILQQSRQQVCFSEVTGTRNPAGTMKTAANLSVSCMLCLHNKNMHGPSYARTVHARDTKCVCNGFHERQYQGTRGTFISPANTCSVAATSRAFTMAARWSQGDRSVLHTWDGVLPSCAIVGSIHTEVLHHTARSEAFTGCSVMSEVR
jgi:hypothetical protein